ncbi:MAG: hypothetical protein HKN26_14655, partial [Acidimicrobiales bacterium]|nr:hypothetical protein [Acidimicrobiales bacterium]
RTTANAKERLETAENRLDEKTDELEGLEEELAETLLDINQKWDEIAENIEPFEVRLEKTDISIDQLALLWVPVSR